MVNETESVVEPTMTREPPSFAQQQFLKSVRYIYRGPLANLFRWRCVMLLTTTGRKSGLPRTTGVSFMRLDDYLVIFSGWGVSSSWYHNIRDNPEVTLQFGNRTIRATARLVGDPERRQELMNLMARRSRECGPPAGMRQVLAAVRLFDYEGEIRRAVEHARTMPVFELIPHEPLS